MPVQLEVTQHNMVGEPMKSIVTAKTPTKAEFKKVLGPLSLMINEKMLRSFGMDSPIELKDQHGRLYMTIRILSFDFDK